MTETALQEPRPARESVHYTPGNCALLMGPAEVLLRHLEAVRLVGLRPALLCTDMPDLDRLPRGLRVLGPACPGRTSCPHRRLDGGIHRHAENRHAPGGPGAPFLPRRWPF